MGIALLLRHGRSTANVDGILAGRTPGVTLHESGRAQAASIAAAFADLALDSIHVSPMERTRETAELALPNRAHTIAEEIIELDCGIFAGRPFTEIESVAAWQDMRNDPAAFTFPEGESIRGAAERVIGYITSAAAAPGLHVFVTHADNILMMANHAANAALGAYQRLHVAPCSLTVVRVEGVDAQLLALNVPPSGAAELLSAYATHKRDSV